MDSEKTKEDLISELEHARERITELENQVSYDNYVQENSSATPFPLDCPIFPYTFLNQPGWPIESISEDIVHVLAYRDKELTARKVHFESFIHPDDLPNVIEEFEYLNQNPTTKQYALKPFRIINKRNEIKWLINTISNVQIEDGKISRFVGLIVDISKHTKPESKLDMNCMQVRKELEIATAEMVEGEKELDKLAHIISHDFKAPLRGINQLVSWIKEDHIADGNIQLNEKIVLIENRVNKLHRMIEALVIYARVKMKNQDIELVDIQELIDDTIDFASPPDNFEITTDIKYPAIKTSRIRLEQIMLYIIRNAIKFNDKPIGKIAISCEMIDNSIRFIVSDNGQGIQKKMQKKVFNIFYKLNHDCSHDSTGIGLAVVYKIIKMMKGRVWIESNSAQGISVFLDIPQK